MQKKTFFIILAIAFIFALLAWKSAASYSTEVIAFSPAASSTEGLPAEQGSCFASSIAAPYRADAWRCTVGNAISDPCFAISAASSTLLCPSNGATSSAAGFVLYLDKPLPKPDIPAGGTPENWAWKVELKDGTLCTPFTGTRVGTADGRIATYSCNGEAKNEEFLFDDLNASSSVWKAEAGMIGAPSATSGNPFPAAAYLHSAPVKEVWQ